MSRDHFRRLLDRLTRRFGLRPIGLVLELGPMPRLPDGTLGEACFVVTTRTIRLWTATESKLAHEFAHCLQLDRGMVWPIPFAELMATDRDAVVAALREFAALEQAYQGIEDEELFARIFERTFRRFLT